MKFKCITLNIEHGGILMDNILDFLKSEKPDILFLQEVYNSHNINLENRFRSVTIIAEELKELTPFHDFRGYAYDPDVECEMGLAIYSKFPLGLVDIFFFDVPYGSVTFTGEHNPLNVPRAIQFVQASSDLVTLNLYNIHGVWGYDGLDSPRRIKMSQDIAEVIKDKTNVILAGDTNFDTKATETIRIIEDAGVESVFGNSLTSTFNMAHKDNPGYATASVDMIFKSKNINVLDKKICEVDISDHYPLLAVFEIE